MNHPMVSPIKIEFGLSGNTFSEVGRVQDADVIYKLIDNLLVGTNVNDPNEYVYSKGYKGSNGFAGRKISFKMCDGTTREEEGPWKTSYLPFAPLAFSQRIIALKRKPTDSYHRDVYEDILLYDEKPQRGLIGAEVLAKAFSLYLGCDVYYSTIKDDTFRASGCVQKDSADG